MLFLNQLVSYFSPDFLWCRFIIRGPQANVEFLVDNLQLFMVPENSNWRAESYTNIDTYRKSNINFV